MNDETIHNLLASRRPGDEITDPDVIAALNAIDADETLRRAAEADLQFDESLRAALKEEIPIPAGLAERLLAIPQQIQPAAAEEKIIPISRRGMFGWIGAIAAAVVTGGYFLTRPKTTIAFDRWKNEAAKWANAPKLRLQSPDIAALKAELAKSGALIPADVPSVLVKFPTLGCQILQVDQGQVSIVCFNRDGNAYHLFTAEAATVADASGFLETNGPKLWAEAGWNFASWKSGSQGYMLLTQASAEDLKSVFA